MGSVDTDRMYMCIDLKSFYASVECADLGLDPFTTPLVVADGSRGKGAITLAISPALKKLGVKNRSRLFEIPPHIEYLTVKPHMKRYMQVSAQVCGARRCTCVLYRRVFYRYYALLAALQENAP